MFIGTTKFYRGGKTRSDIGIGQVRFTASGRCMEPLIFELDIAGEMYNIRRHVFISLYVVLLTNVCVHGHDFNVLNIAHAYTSMVKMIYIQLMRTME